MMRTALRTLPILALVLGMVATTMSVKAQEHDNTISFSGGYGVTNPCNGELASGTIDVHIVVTTAQTGNGDVKVNVHHNSHAKMTGSLGNEYLANRRAKGQFDATSSSYVLDWFGEFIGKGSAPNFNGFGQLRVFTNANNEPTGSQLILQSTACQ